MPQPNYTTPELIKFLQLLGHEAMLKYGSSPKVSAVASAEGVDPRKVSIRSGTIPGASGVTRLTQGQGAPYEIAIDMKNTADDAARAGIPSTQASLVALIHELQHVKDLQADPNYRPTTNELSVTGGHFAGDSSDDIFPFEGRKALQMMIDRLNQN